MPVEQTKANIYSRDRNIWHLSHEGGVLEDPANAPEEAMWQWIVSPESAPDKPAEVEIGFERRHAGVGERQEAGAVALLEELNAIAAANGVGRIDLVENRLVGMKSRGAYETPGGTLLVLAHRELEALCVDRETAHYAQMLSLRYAELVYYGLWFTALREALDGFFTAVQQRVTGTVGLRLYKGNVNVTRRQSPYSLYRKDLASFTMTHYNPKDAEGFINLFALPVIRCRRQAQVQARERAPAQSRRRETNLGRPVRSAARTSCSTSFSARFRLTAGCCLTNWRWTARGRGRFSRPAF